MRAFAEFLLEFASTGWGPVVMVMHSFLESFILPIAHELFLIPVALARPEYSLLFALMSTIASVAGISVGYLIGKVGGRPLLLRFIKPRLFILAKKEIHKYDVWAVAVACFTPVPVKVFALVAGAVHLNYKKMILVAFLARGLRFFLVSILLYFYGASIRAFILDYMDWMMIVLFVLMIVSVLSWKGIEAYLMRKERIV